jgi:hypothetical protein
MNRFSKPRWGGWSCRRRRTTKHWKSCSYRPLLMLLEDRTVPGFLAPLSFDAGTGP